MYDIITDVKRGKRLSDEVIREMVFAYTAGDIPDYQMSSFLMAVCLKGLSDAETAALTNAIADSGKRLDLSLFGDLTVDKHSTGGVGDKVTLVVAPIASSLGCKVAKMSGRGLGHTGGTVDKLESIPGFRTTLTEAEFISQVEDIGIAVIGQSEGLAPADKKLYALRDVTATVDSIPLITSSIMGKKLASGTKNIVLDVKYGSGAFMKTPEEAGVLAKNMVDIGKSLGRRVCALITDMDTPLGLAVGNLSEVIEAREVLLGRGPADLREVALAVSAEMLSLAKGMAHSEALLAVTEALDSGCAYKKFVEWLTAQGGCAKAANDPASVGSAKYERCVSSPKDGFVLATDAEKIGLSSLTLGAGRKTKEDVIDPLAAVILNKKRGDRVVRGETLATLYSNDESLLDEAESILLSAYSFSKTEPKKEAVINRIIR